MALNLTKTGNLFYYDDLDAKTLSETNKTRKAVGLAPIVVTERTCMAEGCGKKFMSQGKANRFCKPCREKEESIYEFSNRSCPSYEGYE